MIIKLIKKDIDLFNKNRHKNRFLLKNIPENFKITLSEHKKMNISSIGGSEFLNFGVDIINVTNDHFKTHIDYVRIYFYIKKGKIGMRFANCKYYIGYRRLTFKPIDKFNTDLSDNIITPDTNTWLDNYPSPWNDDVAKLLIRFSKYLEVLNLKIISNSTYDDVLKFALN